jgi:hypothetical protein
MPTFADRRCRVVNTADPYGSILCFLDRSRYLFFQGAPQLYSRGWVDPVPDPLLLIKSVSAGNRTRVLWICSQELWPHHRGGLVEVEVTLRPMVSRPVRLGVLPLLEQVTRCYIYLSDNYFLYFSCRAPSLTRGRVCNLQSNDANPISSYIATDGLSASSSWCRALNGDHSQILISLFDNYFLCSQSV